MLTQLTKVCIGNLPCKVWLVIGVWVAACM